MAESCMDTFMTATGSGQQKKVTGNLTGFLSERSRYVPATVMVDRHKWFVWETGPDQGKH